MKTSTKVTEVKPLGKMTYGAPELQTLYNKYAFRGLMFAIIFALAVSGTVFVYNSIKADVDTESDKFSNEFIFNEITLPAPPVTADVPEQTEPEVPQKVALKDLEALIPQPVAKVESDILTTKTQDRLNEVTQPVASEGTDDPGKVTADLDDNLGTKNIEEEIKKEEPKTNQIFQQFEVEKAPSAVNLGSIKGSMKYPEIARTMGTEGKCVAKLLIGTSGEVLKVGGISGPDVFHSEISDKIMRLQFTPALQNGQPVKCWVSVPFSFSLGK